MIKFYQGITRKVLIIGNFAFKFPNTSYGHNNFLQGCYANWSERKYCKDFKNADYEDNLYKFVCPSYFCSWFGIIQIQAKCDQVLNELNGEEIKNHLPLCGTDSKKENFGYFKGRLVCLDYP